MTDYGNGASGDHMPGDQAPEMHEGEPKEDWRVALDLGCKCDPPSRYKGPWHDERCPLYQLPDYGVFQPDE